MASEEIGIKLTVRAVGLVLAVEFLVLAAVRAGLGPSLAVLGAARLLDGAVLLFLAARQAGGVSAVGLGPGSFRPGLKTGLVWSAAFGLAAGCGMAALAMNGMNPLRLLRVSLPTTGLGLALYFIVGGLIAPVVEELFFRGVIFGFLRRWGLLIAIPASTLIFILPHCGHGLPITQAVGGIVFALAYHYSGSLTAPIIIHSLGNLALFSLSLLPA